MDKQELLGTGRAFLLAIVICLLLGSCKTTKVIDERESYERASVSIDSIKVDSSSVNISHTLTSIDSQIETIRVIEVYSSPDSLGRQYLVSKETITNKATNKTVEERNDSLSVNCTTEETKGVREQINEKKEYHKDIKSESNSWVLSLGIITGVVLGVIFFILFLRLIIKFR